MTNTSTQETQEQNLKPAPIQKEVILVQTENTSLKPITSIKDKLAPIKDKLQSIIEASIKNSSLLSRAAQFWNERPLWQKITAGVVLSLPFLVIGILTNLISLICVSIVIALVFTGTSLLFDNHQTQTSQSNEGMVEIISNLTDVIDEVFSALEDLAKQLAKDIDVFEQENERLKDTINHLKNHTKSLSLEITLLNDIQKALYATRDELQRNNINFVKALQKQSESYNLALQELNDVKSAYKESSTSLNKKIVELKMTNSLMDKDLEQARSIGLVLRSTVDTLSKAVIVDKEQREAFQLRLNEFLANKSKSFDQIAERICEAEGKLTLVTQELEQSNQKYQALLEQQEQLIVRLEHVDEPQPSRTKQKGNSAKALKHFGLYACDKTMAPPSQQLCSNTITEITAR